MAQGEMTGLEQNKQKKNKTANENTAKVSWSTLGYRYGERTHRETQHLQPTDPACKRTRTRRQKYKSNVLTRSCDRRGENGVVGVRGTRARCRCDRGGGDDACGEGVVGSIIAVIGVNGGDRRLTCTITRVSSTGSQRRYGLWRRRRSTGVVDVASSHSMVPDIMTTRCLSDVFV